MNIKLCKKIKIINNICSNNIYNKRKNWMWANHIRLLSNSVKIKGKYKPQSWHDINWKEAIENIKILQEKLVIATQRKNYKEIYKL